jgi:chromosome segregation ATPase
LLASLTFAFAALGCAQQQQQDLTTIKGLQEQVKVLQGEVKDRDKRIDELKKERSAGGAEAQGKIEELKREFEDRVSKIEQLHKAKVTQLDSEIANLRLELGSVQREKIALQEINDRAPRISAANTAKKGYDVMVLGVLVLALIAVLLYVVFRYRSLHDRLNLLVMQHSSELRRLGAYP